MSKLNDIQKDVLSEIINIGIGKAGNLFNDILETHITLNVPKINIIPASELDPLLKKMGYNQLSSVQQKFHGRFGGTSALMFPTDSVQNLVSALTGEKADTPEFDTLRDGTLMEIGNILNNALLGTMSNFFKLSFDFDLPEFEESEIDKLFQPVVNPDSDGIILLSEANFFVESLQLKGFILLVFNLKNIELLTSLLDRIIEEEGND